MNQKLTALSLEQLAKQMPVLSEQEQQAYWGGGTGTKDDPYTYAEFFKMSNSGSFPGGYVDLGDGVVCEYVASNASYEGLYLEEVIITGNALENFRREREIYGQDGSGFWGLVPGYEFSEESHGGGSPSGVPRIDLSRVEFWNTQEPRECYRACVKILSKYGVRPQGGSPNQKILVADQSGTDLYACPTYMEALNYIQDQLRKGNPVIVGVDDGARVSTHNNHSATEHFLVIVGMGEHEGKQYFHYYDVGTQYQTKGTSPDNRLFITEGNLLQGTIGSGKYMKRYTVTEVRKNIEQ